MSTPYRSTIILSVVCLHCLGATLFAQSQQLTYEDISSPVLPQNGDWGAYSVWPD